MVTHSLLLWLYWDYIIERLWLDYDYNVSENLWLWLGYDYFVNKIHDYDYDSYSSIFIISYDYSKSVAKCWQVWFFLFSLKMWLVLYKIFFPAN